MSNAIALPSSDDAEEWRPVPGYEETYLISSLGRVFSRPRRRCRGGYLKIKIGKRGYPACALVQNCIQKTYEIHRLMASAFLGPRPEGGVVRHLDGNPLNCHISNLKWGTPHENNMDRLAHGRDHNANKTHCPQGHPYDEANTIKIPSRPTARYCRACNYARVYARNAAQRAARTS